MKLDVHEMEEMIDGYLAFARGEQGEKPEEFDLTDILEELRERAEREGAQVTLTTTGDLHLTARRKVLQRGLANLVTNATRYGGAVWITARRDGEKVEVMVDDDGPGIPEEMREEVFRPFFRLEESRNPETGGTGLGLTIARDAVRFHGGELVLLDRPDAQGLRARVRIPVVLDRSFQDGWLGTD
jgi:two-component system osmolarity sensor histidine kinase EnvZ